MFYLVILPILAFSFIGILNLHEFSKHDRHLFAFSQLRREVISFLYANYSVMNRKDYLALRQLLKVLNITIHEYSEYKTVLFNFRLFLKYFKELEKIETNNEKIDSDEPDILNLISRMNNLVINAFFAYTPLLRSEIVLHILLSLVKIAIKSKINLIKDHMVGLENLLEITAKYQPRLSVN